MQPRRVAGGERRAHARRGDRSDDRAVWRISRGTVAGEAPFAARARRRAGGSGRRPRRRRRRGAPANGSALARAEPLGMQHPVHLRRARRPARPMRARPGGGEGAGVGAAAEEAGPMAGGERGRLVEEEDLGVALAHHLPRRPRYSSEAGDPGAVAQRRRPRACAGPVEAPAAVAHQRAALGHGVQRCRQARSGSAAARARRLGGEQLHGNRGGQAPTSGPGAAGCGRGWWCCTTPPCHGRGGARRGFATRPRRSRRTGSSPRTGGCGGWSTRTTRAWHAGAGEWGGRGDVNSRSIGIELANAGPLAGFPPFPEPQMAALERLLDRVLGALGASPGRGDRALRHGARAQGGPGAEARLAAAGARRAGGLGRGGGRLGRGRLGRRSGARRPPSDTAPRGGDWRRGARGVPPALPAGARAAEPLGPADVGLMQALAAAYPCVDRGAVPT